MSSLNEFIWHHFEISSYPFPGPSKPGTARKMMGSPRQLESAVPTSKNPHGVWVWASRVRIPSRNWPPSYRLNLICHKIISQQQQQQQQQQQVCKSQMRNKFLLSHLLKNNSFNLWWKMKRNEPGLRWKRQKQKEKQHNLDEIFVPFSGTGASRASSFRELKTYFSDQKTVYFYRIQFTASVHYTKNSLSLYLS